MADLTLAEYLALALRTPYQPGAHDCCLCPANWVQMNRGLDPASAYRGLYATEGECVALLASLGGVEAVARTGMGSIGLSETPDPVAGDVGVVSVETVSGPVIMGAICTGPRWAILSPGGMSFVPADVVVAWKV